MVLFIDQTVPTYWSSKLIVPDCLVIHWVSSPGLQESVLADLYPVFCFGYRDNGESHLKSGKARCLKVPGESTLETQFSIILLTSTPVNDVNKRYGD